MWAAIAYLIGRAAVGRIIWGGILASPLIGLSIGWASRRFSGLWERRPVIISLASLYIAAGMFGLAVGLFDAFTGDRQHRIASAAIGQSIVGVLWGITLTGYVLFLWPLAYLNHWLLERASTGR